MHKWIATLGLVVVTGLAAAGTPHQHGVAQLMVVVEGANLELEFISPLENLVGFEHAPRNDKEREAMQTLKDRFRKPEDLFVPSAAAQCRAPAVEPALPNDNGKHGHADMHATLVFECKTRAALKGIELRLFDSFPRLQRIKVQLVTEERQSAVELNRQQRRLAW